MIYKIGIYKSGQQMAKAVFMSKLLKEVKIQFMYMFINTKFCPEGTDNQPATAIEAWGYKHFKEDTNHVAVFKCKNEKDVCITEYKNQGMISNKL